MKQNGDTVLHIAAAMARKKLTKIILQAKCNTALKNKVIQYNTYSFKLCNMLMYNIYLMNILFLICMKHCTTIV